MADGTLIGWTDATWTVVQGCDPVSPGCTHCYVPKELWRMAHNPDRKISAPLAGLAEKHKGKLRFTGKIALREDRLDWPRRWREPRNIFVPSHGDLFHKDVPDAFIDRVFAVMQECPRHTFQVLTKRQDRMHDYVRRVWNARKDNAAPAIEGVGPDGKRYTLGPWRFEGEGWHDWPLPNVILGVSIEDQERAALRRPALRELAAAGWATFVSYEPALGLVDWTGWEFLDGLISGGESGKDSRPSHPAWHRAAREFCDANGIRYFFKQWGDWGPICALGESDDLYYPAPERDPEAPRRCRHDSVVLHADGRSFERNQAGGFHRSIDPDAFAAGSGAMTMFRVGKARAGNLLDGRKHTALPDFRIREGSDAAPAYPSPRAGRGDRGEAAAGGGSAMTPGRSPGQAPRVSIEAMIPGGVRPTDHVHCVTNDGSCSRCRKPENDDDVPLMLWFGAGNENLLIYCGACTGPDAHAVLAPLVPAVRP